MAKRKIEKKKKEQNIQTQSYLDRKLENFIYKLGEKEAKIIIACFIGLASSVVIYSTVFLFTSISSNDIEEPKNETDRIINEQINEALTEEERKSLTLEEQYLEVFGESGMYYLDYLTLGDEDKPEFLEEDVQVYYNQLIIYAQSASYDKIMESIEDKIREYKFTEEYNWKITNLYHDSLIMLSSNEIPSDRSSNYYIKADMVKNLKDPVMKAISALMVNEEVRRYILFDMDSISPIFNGNVEYLGTDIISIEEDSIDRHVESIYNNYGSVQSVHKIKLLIENRRINAYLIENLDKTFSLITYQMEDGNHPYQTIRYWIDLDSKLSGANLTNTNNSPSNSSLHTYEPEVFEELENMILDDMMNSFDGDINDLFENYE
ncbi:MAG: hypothetical protein R3Y64_09345 [Peptostreptococcaceae bacterium]